MSHNETRRYENLTRVTIYRMTRRNSSHKKWHETRFCRPGDMAICK